jgi:hypothetical protein
MTKQTKTQLHCEMSKECGHPVTHLEYKGFVYCKECAMELKWSRRIVRALRPWEIKMLQAGQALPSYEPKRKPVTVRAEVL